MHSLQFKGNVQNKGHGIEGLNAFQAPFLDFQREPTFHADLFEEESPRFPEKRLLSNTFFDDLEEAESGIALFSEAESVVNNVYLPEPGHSPAEEHVAPQDDSLSSISEIRTEQERITLKDPVQIGGQNQNLAKNLSPISQQEFSENSPRENSPGKSDEQTIPTCTIDNIVPKTVNLSNQEVIFAFKTGARAKPCIARPRRKKSIQACRDKYEQQCLKLQVEYDACSDQKQRRIIRNKLFSYRNRMRKREQRLSLQPSGE